MTCLLDRIHVFTTGKTMHQRFTPKEKRTVFVLDTSQSVNSEASEKKDCPVKNEERNPTTLNTANNNNHSEAKPDILVCPNTNEDANTTPLNRGCSKRNKRRKKQSFNFAANKRTDPQANNSEVRNANVCTNVKIPPQNPKSYNFEYYTPNLGRKTNNYYVTDEIEELNQRSTSPIIFSPFWLPQHSRRTRSSRSRRKRGRVSKEQLDDEIDSYMAEVDTQQSGFEYSNPLEEYIAWNSKYAS